MHGGGAVFNLVILSITNNLFYAIAYKANLALCLWLL